VSESMTRGSGQAQGTTLSDSAIGCVYRSDDALDAATAQLLGLGLTADTLHVGASDVARAQTAALRTGIRADVEPEDPLRGLVDVATEFGARAAVDRAGVAGAIIGALAGLGLSLTPMGSAIAVTHGALAIANIGFYFVLGAIVGSVLGAALTPQPSTHVGFRLIDGMNDGSYALVVVSPRERHDELQAVLEAAGGTGITRV
jgi:hypothetical protein